MLVPIIQTGAQHPVVSILLGYNKYTYNYESGKNPFKSYTIFWNGVEHPVSVIINKAYLTGWISRHVTNMLVVSEVTKDSPTPDVWITGLVLLNTHPPV